MDAMKKGWFSELSSLWPGQCFSIAVNKLLCAQDSEFQSIIVFERYAGCTVNSFVLIIGGGDGGVARELCKHPLVKHITVCEIDDIVIDVAKKYLPSMAKSFDDSKVTVCIQNGVHFVQNTSQKYDVVITDAPDPVGPAKGLFESNYFQSLRNILTDNGVICCQSESIWYNLDLVKQLLCYARAYFPSALYATANVPTYPGGQIGMLVACVDPEVVIKCPKWLPSEDQCVSMGLRYYNPSVHSMSFVLPQFVRLVLASNGTQ